MKKLIIGLVVLVALAAVVLVGSHFFLGSIVQRGVNRFGPSITQTNVELDGAAVSPFTGVGTLTGLRVANPAGWSDANALSLGEVHIDLEPRSVFGDHIVINEIVVDRPQFVYETKIVSSNIGDLLNNIEQSVGRKGDEPKTEEGAPIKMVVKKLVIQNGTVTLGVGPAAMTLPMPPVNLTDIGTAEGGVTPAQVAFAVMRSVTTSVVAATTQALTKSGGTSGAAAVEGVRQVGEAIKGLFGGQKKTEPKKEP